MDDPYHLTDYLPRKVDNHVSMNRIDTTRSAYAAVASWLSTSRTNGEPEIPRHQEFRSMTDALHREFSVSYPCLSLHHDKIGNDGTSHHCVDRKVAEDRAVSLLSRPLLLTNEMHQLSESLEPMLSDSRYSVGLLENVYTSFAILVESRLRAYTNVLGNHAQKLRSTNKSSNIAQHRNAAQSLEEKANVILTTGSQIHAEDVRTKFTVQENVVPVVDGSQAPTMLTCDVTMNLSVPLPTGETDRHIVTFSTAGSIAESSGAIDALVTVDLDVRQLLNNMIEQAARVVSFVVAIASIGCNAKMPQASARNTGLFARNVKNSDHSGLDLLCNAAVAELPIVSPALSGSSASQLTVVDFDLTAVDDEDAEIDVVANLSVDQCANIVDTCLFGDVPPPPFKKMKLI